MFAGFHGLSGGLCTVFGGFGMFTRTKKPADKGRL